MTERVAVEDIEHARARITRSAPVPVRIRGQDPVVLLWALGALAIVTVSIAAGLLQARAKPVPYLIPNTTYFPARNRVNVPVGGVILHRTSYVSYGGVTTIDWFDSDIEPIVPDEFVIVSLYVDGRTVASTVKGSVTGTYEDGPAELTWTGVLPRGRHLVELSLYAPAAVVGVPYTDPGQIAVDSLTIVRGQDAG